MTSSFRTWPLQSTISSHALATPPLKGKIGVCSPGWTDAQGGYDAPKTANHKRGQYLLRPEDSELPVHLTCRQCGPFLTLSNTAGDKIHHDV